MTNFVFKQCTNFVVDAYKETSIKFDETQNQQKGRTYTSLSSMLKENFFLDSTKFGENFIA